MQQAFTLLILVLLISACGGGVKNSDTTAAAVNTEAAPEQMVLPSGENFSIKVLVDTIKSPRKELTGQIAGVDIRINYGSPAVNKRTIFGDLVPFGSVWRTGANEVTRISFAQPVLLGDLTKAVPAGTYALLSQPTDKTNWVVMLNEEAFMWGAYDYDASKDVAKFAATATISEQPAERLDFSLDETSIRLHWADLVLHIPVKAAQ